MRIAVDLNVLLDVAQNRVPHYQASEEVLARARRRVPPLWPTDFWCR
jgi:hypothetical protein